MCIIWRCLSIAYFTINNYPEYLFEQANQNKNLFIKIFEIYTVKSLAVGNCPLKITLLLSSIFAIKSFNPPSCTCSDSHVRSACIWPDTLCISVHLYEKYAILVIILHCYIVITPGRYIFLIYFFCSYYMLNCLPVQKKFNEK